MGSIGGQQRVSDLYVKGLHIGTDGAQSVVGVAVDLANKSVSLVASNASRLDRRAKLNALSKINRVAMPAASVLVTVAERIEESSSELVKRVSGKPMPAKAVATRKLNAAKRKAATTRKRITKTAVQQMDDVVETGETIAKTAKKEVNKQVNKAVATRKKITKTATKRVSKAVADTATQTSNAARRVARKAEAAAEAA